MVFPSLFEKSVVAVAVLGAGGAAPGAATSIKPRTTSSVGAPITPTNPKCKSVNGVPKYKDPITGETYMCATTSAYYDQTEGPCSVGPTTWQLKADGNKADQNSRNWVFTTFTAALNVANMQDVSVDGKVRTADQLYSDGVCKKSSDADGNIYKSCGGCYKICNTGGQLEQGDAKHSEHLNRCITVKVTNNCKDGFHGDWQNNFCGQSKPSDYWTQNPDAVASDDELNKFGYAAHFDLMDLHGQITGKVHGDSELNANATNPHSLNWYQNNEVFFKPVRCEDWKGNSWDTSDDNSNPGNIESDNYGARPVLQEEDSTDSETYQDTILTATNGKVTNPTSGAVLDINPHGLDYTKFSGKSWEAFCGNGVYDPSSNDPWKQRFVPTEGAGSQYLPIVQASVGGSKECCSNCAESGTDCSSSQNCWSVTDESQCSYNSYCANGKDSGCVFHN